MRLLTRLLVVALLVVVPACSSSGGGDGGPTGPGGPVNIQGDWNLTVEITSVEGTSCVRDILALLIGQSQPRTASIQQNGNQFTATVSDGNNTETWTGTINGNQISGSRQGAGGSQTVNCTDGTSPTAEDIDLTFEAVATTSTMDGTVVQEIRVTLNGNEIGTVTVTARLTGTK